MRKMIYILPPDFFEIKKQVILIEVPYYEKNGTSSKRFLKKFHELTTNLYETKIKWITKKMRNLFRLWSKSPHPACGINEGCVHVKKIILLKRNRMLRFDGKNIQT